MKILFLADNFVPERNAQASTVYERACYWAAWGHEVTVITCAPNFPEGEVYSGYRNRWHFVETISGIRVVRVKTFISGNTGRWRRIADYLSYGAASFVAGLFEGKPDVIVATSPQFFAAVSGCVLATVRRLPFVMEIRDLWPESIVAVGAMNRRLPLILIEKLELYLYKRAAAIVVVTGAFKENLVSRGVPEKKITVVINGVDLSRFQPRDRDDSLAAQWGLS